MDAQQTHNVINTKLLRQNAVWRNDYVFLHFVFAWWKFRQMQANSWRHAMGKFVATLGGPLWGESIGQWWIPITTEQWCAIFVFIHYNDVIMNTMAS